MDFFALVTELLAQQDTYTIDPDRLEFPQDKQHGDVALPCFPLAKEHQAAPQQIAATLAESLSPTKKISGIEAVGPYVNFTIAPAFLAATILPKLLRQKRDFGKGANTGECIVVESPSPNTNKPLHLGHVRNMLLGNALCDILSFSGHDVVRSEVVNDRGIHICKSMIAYQRYGNGQEPDKKPDHFVGDWYVLYNQKLKEDPSLEADAKELLQQRETGDPDVTELREKMNKRALEGFAQTYQRYNVEIDKAYYESDHYQKGKELVLKKAEEGVFARDDEGNIVYDFGEDSYGKKVLLRHNGTAIYITQDLALAELRRQDFKMDRMIYVVGNEQEYHFNVLFALLDLLGYEFADSCHHLSYGMVNLPDGKMKSREGNVVDADDLAETMHAQAASVLDERYPDLDKVTLKERAETIAMGAIKFFILKYDATKDFVFDREHSLRFDGETGPYIQYTHARCCSLLEQGKRDNSPSHLDLLTNDQERVLLAHIAQFSNVVKDAADKYQPYLIARYTLELAHLFNAYYQHHTVNQEDADLQQARLSLVAGVKELLANCLHLLGIEAPVQM